MFERSFIESSFNATKANRRWATLLSMALQAVLVGGLILLPLLFTDALPVLAKYAEIVPPPPAAPRGTGGGTRVEKPVRGEVRPTAIREPRAFPDSIPLDVDDSNPAPYVGVGSGPVGGGYGNGTEVGLPGVDGGLGDVLHVAMAPKPAVLPPPPKAEPKRLPVSQGVLEGLLIHRIVPVYPELARRARVVGAVTLRAVISKEGMIENLRMTTGHPLLAQAALDAVRQWRYRPYRLNGEPVEVETEITVNFTFAN